MDLEKLTHDVIRLVRKAGDYARDQRLRINEKDIEVKGHGDYVSHVDKDVEEMLRDGLTKLIPDSTVMAEETTPDAQGGSWRWIVDPIDGTTNYLIGVPVYAISIALEDRRSNPSRFGPLAIGVVAEPGLGVTYDAWRGGGARRNGKSIQVNKHRNLHDATVATAFPFRERDRIEQYRGLFRDIYPQVADFR
ncbi:MAG: inositol monophosphatase family protein, partial [Chloroflexota bacterium]